MTAYNTLFVTQNSKCFVLSSVVAIPAVLGAELSRSCHGYIRSVCPRFLYISWLRLQAFLHYKDPIPYIGYKAPFLTYKKPLTMLVSTNYILNSLFDLVITFCLSPPLGTCHMPKLVSVLVRISLFCFVLTIQHLYRLANTIFYIRRSVLLYFLTCSKPDT